MNLESEIQQRPVAKECIYICCKGDTQRILPVLSLQNVGRDLPAACHGSGGHRNKC